MQNNNGPKKFMGLGGNMFSRSMVQPWGNMQPPQYAPMPMYGGSMIIDNSEQQKSLPDIYTTCPELKKFQMPILIAQPTPNEFNLPPRQIPMAMPPPPPMAAPPPVWRPPHIHTPRPPPQVYMKFDPNAPIIRPYVLFYLEAEFY
ncbi:hypothetical protein TVAG_256480 [Trichomonas vaginalis G3]|uniref:Uncharacterized protein n=1 Tax=Trichomonas vaginalis (strain ATCC PRA-98 / G3) TaxID=412133 RepID=A2FHB0_TRIV3|nr:hypothetical protein TVAGG3_1006950 [Trichomonas vaginalis G3]EAX95707.1 hypothetical protein TVAG_256480 [Trichomonas vaginalis G3]KAI5491200.1 hypothetical protein TVAGG3_1006950 [Trichomonas vaginalis G3]|eukprot:XP_001308637.1 hypothetical protein [Trichomonas vaginalis G3]